MPLVTLRSLPEWATFLAGEEISAVKSIWAEIVAAVVEDKLPACTHKPVPNFHIPGIVRSIVLRGRPVSRYIWFPRDFLPCVKETIVDNAVFAELNQQLEPVLIRSVDMDSWLHSRDDNDFPRFTNVRKTKDKPPPPNVKQPGSKRRSGRYHKKDLALFPAIEALMSERNCRVHMAVGILDEEGRIEGASSNSRRDRLARKYRQFGDVRD